MGNIGPQAGHYDVLAEADDVRVRQTVSDPADPAPLPSPEPIPDPLGPGPEPVPSPPTAAR